MLFCYGAGSQACDRSKTVGVGPKTYVDAPELLYRVEGDDFLQ